MKAKFEKIKASVLKNRGGLSGASDSEIMTIWNSLTPETQKQYLESVKNKEASDATGT